LLVLMLVLLIKGNPVGRTLILLPCALILAIGGLVARPFARRYYENQLLIYPDGLVRAEHNRFRVFLWDDVEAVWQSITEVYTNGVHTQTMFMLRFKRRDGEELTINKGIPMKKVDEVAARVQDNITERLMPGVLERFNAGQPVSFGPLTVSQ